MIFELGHDPRLQYSQGEMKKGVENVFYNETFKFEFLGAIVALFNLFD